jgi:hypothetical protein
LKNIMIKQNFLCRKKEKKGIMVLSGESEPHLSKRLNDFQENR